MVKSAGLAIIHDNKILLVKPKGVNLTKSYSIPKGLVEQGESYLETAIRETFEETGIKIDRKLIKENIPMKINYINNNIITKCVYYFFVDYSRYSIDEVLSIDQLQEDEISFAAFFTKEEAKPLIFWRQEIILNQF